jgi:hypothetical protein
MPAGKSHVLSVDAVARNIFEEMDAKELLKTARPPGGRGGRHCGHQPERLLQI